MMTILELAEKSQQIEHIYQVDQNVYYAFQQCSKDYNPLHTDRQFAESKGFPSCVMYGNILNAFISHFVGMLLPTREVMIQSQEINFHKPVFLNDDILLKASVDTVSEAVGIIQYKLKFYRTNAEKPQFVAKGSVQIGLLK